MMPFKKRNTLKARATRNKNCHKLPSTLKMEAQLPTKPTNPEIINYEVLTELPQKLSLSETSLPHFVQCIVAPFLNLINAEHTGDFDAAKTKASACRVWLAVFQHINTKLPLLPHNIDDEHMTPFFTVENTAGGHDNFPID